MFSPIRTKRLTIRSVVQSDAESLWLRRSDPRVAEYQDWTVPTPREGTDEIIAGAAQMDGPANNEWWMTTIVLTDSNEIIGDIALRLSSGSHIAEIGYTFDSDRWGNGYATEALRGLIPYLFEEVGVTRISGMLHPDNQPSARVMERNGFVFEGHVRNSYWEGGEMSDDVSYSLTPQDWEVWTSRLTEPPREVRLVDLTSEIFDASYSLAIHKSQEQFVAPIPRSLSQALVPPRVAGSPLVPWYRMIEADGAIVGFVMLAMGRGNSKAPVIWRLLIDRLHQRREIGSLALGLVEDHVRDLGHSELLTSYLEGRGSPGPFYQSLGYEPTGESWQQETVARKSL